MSILAQPECEPHVKRDNSAQFHARFARFRSLLHFTACRILGGPEEAEVAVRNCWRKASRNPPAFIHDGEFRSWLLRLLIDEAFAIRLFRQWPRLAINALMRGLERTPCEVNTKEVTMVPFIGPQFVAHLFNVRPNGENRAGTSPAARVHSGAFDRSTFLLNFRLTVIEITEPEKNHKEKVG